MRLAVIAHLKYPIAEPYAGGLEMHTHLLVSRLADRGHDVTLFAAAGTSFATSSARRINVVSVVEPTIDADPSAVDAIEDAAYRRIVAQIDDGQFDLVHFNALHYRPLQALVRRDRPLVAVLHTPPFDPLEHAMRAASCVRVAVSSSLKQRWRIDDAMLVIDNGIDLDRFRFGAARRQKTAIWSGRIVPEKGVHLAIAAARAAAIPLDIAGPIVDHGYWHDEIAPQLGPLVRYLGHLGHDALASAVAGAAVSLCTPRWEEPFGLVLAESLACGTPVAGFARGALPDIVDDLTGVLVNGDDVAALARAIRTCLDLDRRACRTRAECLFDVEFMVDRYEALYRTLLSDKRSAALGAFDKLDTLDAV